MRYLAFLCQSTAMHNCLVFHVARRKKNKSFVKPLFIFNSDVSFYSSSSDLEKSSRGESKTKRESFKMRQLQSEIFMYPKVPSEQFTL